MQGMNRRTFLKLAGAGSVATAAVGAPVAALVARNGGNTLHFEATAGLPTAPWPAYATRVMEGVIDLRDHLAGLMVALERSGQFFSPVRMLSIIQTVGLLGREVIISDSLRQA